MTCAAFPALLLFVVVAPLGPSARAIGPRGHGFNVFAGRSAGLLPIVDFERTRFPIKSRIASRLGVSTEVVDRLTQDPSFYAKDDGSGVFVEEPIDRASSLLSDVQQPGAASAEPGSLGAGPVRADAFSQHSRPGSAKTRYLEFCDSAGATIATSDPPGAVSASFDAALGAGTYYLAVSGEANLRPSGGWSGVWEHRRVPVGREPTLHPGSGHVVDAHGGRQRRAGAVVARPVGWRRGDHLVRSEGLPRPGPVAVFSAGSE